MGTRKGATHIVQAHAVAELDARRVAVLAADAEAQLGRVWRPSFAAISTSLPTPFWSRCANGSLS